MTFPTPNWQKKACKKPPVSDSEVSPSSIEQSNQNSPPPDSAPLTKSQRSRRDAAAPRGVGATDESMRMMASLGRIAAAPSDFAQPCESVVNGGVLLALPALLAAGLLRHASHFFTLPTGYYGLDGLPFFKLNQQFRITATFKQRDGKTLHIRQASRPEEELGEIYQKLGLSPDPYPGSLQKVKI